MNDEVRSNEEVEMLGVKMMWIIMIDSSKIRGMQKVI